MTKANDITKKYPLFSVYAKTKAGTTYTWNFILEPDDSLVFAGKTLLEHKHMPKVKNFTEKTSTNDKVQFTIESNLTFPQCTYTYLSTQFISAGNIEVRHCPKRPSQKTFEWFSNIAPLLLAIENKDSLLVAEIFHKKSSIYMKYPKTIIKLLENIAVEGLFSWIWGRFDDKAMFDLQKIFEGKCTKRFEEWGVAEAFFSAARRRLNISPFRSETIEECMTRFLQRHSGTKLTLGIVGSNHYRNIEKILYEIQEGKKNKKDFLLNTQTFLQAETHNTFDKNAVALYISPSKTKDFTKSIISGYVRKTGAELLRKVYPNRRQFSSKLARIGYLQGGPTGIVIEIVV